MKYNYCDVCSRYGNMDCCGVCCTVKANGEPNMFVDKGGKLHGGDMVKNIRTGEKLIVAGVNHELGQFIPMGYPFPSMEKVSEYELVERNAVMVTEHVVKSLRMHHFDSYVDTESEERDG